MLVIMFIAAGCLGAGQPCVFERPTSRNWCALGLSSGVKRIIYDNSYNRAAIA